MQGDIVGLLDSAGALVVEYRYDAWGKPISITGNLADTLGKRNPFRYRGYVYDEETGLYYLRSRYYNPTVGRFVNADTVLGSVGSLFSHNLFAYCANSPMMKADPSGNIAISLSLLLLMGSLSAGSIVYAGIYSHRSRYRYRHRRRRISLPQVSITAGSVAQTFPADAIANGRNYSGSSATLEKYISAIESAEYYIAWGTGDSVGWDENSPLTLKEALLALGVASCVNLSEYYARGVLQVGEVPFDRATQLAINLAASDNNDVPIWGLYTKNSLAAEGLAFLFGYTGPCEITKADSGYYHFHDKWHIIHIWFGVKY